MVYSLGYISFAESIGVS